MQITQKIISLFLAVLIFALPLLAQNVTDDYLLGKEDGKKAAKGNGLWILAGIGCGIFGVIAAYAVDPGAPPADKILGKSPEYVKGFTEAYQKRYRNRNASNACVGMTLTIALTSFIATMNRANSL